MSTGATIALAVIAGLVVIGGGVTALVFFILRVASRNGGMATLAERYASNAEPQGQRLTRQTAQIGAVRYGGCVTITITEPGLWLHVFNLASDSPPLLIPWADIAGVRETTLKGRKSARLSVGRPEISSVTLPWDVYFAIKQFLKTNGG
ncbi:MAG: hypothetical protein ACOY3P_19175 [Planctomycetota bacterium]